MGVLLESAISKQKSARSQVEHQHLRALPLGQTYGGFVLQPGSVASDQLAAVELDLAARHMHVALALRVEREFEGLVTVEQAGIHPGIGMDTNGTLLAFG